MPLEAVEPEMRRFVVWSTPFFTGNVPLSWTPGTNEKRFSSSLEALEVSARKPPRRPPKLDPLGSS